MSLAGKTLKVCSCNRTVGIDAKALAAALKSSEPLVVHEQLCRKDAAAFQAALGDSEVIVACTQEAALFGELAERADLKFVNVREQAGWGVRSTDATPKIAALVAMAALPEPEPAPAVEFKSGGELLIIGPAAAALDWAERLAGQLNVSVLATQRGELPLERRYPVWSGRVTQLEGWLGAFEVEWRQENPIDLEVCTRCNACVRACPESAIGYDYQIDLDKCKAHRACVAACGAIGAIDFSRIETSRTEKFDLVLDLSREPILPPDREAGGRDARLVFRDPELGRGAVLEHGRRRGLPARVIPFECFHVASIGIDLVLGAIAYGASQLRILVTDKVADSYLAA